MRGGDVCDRKSNFHRSILQEYKIHNADVMIREDVRAILVAVLYAKRF